MVIPNRENLREAFGERPVGVDHGAGGGAGAGDAGLPQGADVAQVEVDIGYALTRSSAHKDFRLYRVLLAQLGEPALRGQHAMLWDGLSRCVTLVDPGVHAALLQIAVNADLWVLPAGAGKALLTFLINLVASDGRHAEEVWGVLVRNFLPQDLATLKSLDASASASHASTWGTGGNATANGAGNGHGHGHGHGRAGGGGESTSAAGAGAMTPSEEAAQGWLDDVDPDAPLAGRALFLVHGALARLSELVPTGAPRVLRVLDARWPHRWWEKRVLTCFMDSVLRSMANWRDLVVNGALGLVVRRLVELDVEIQWEALLGQSAGDGGDTGTQDSGLFFQDDVDMSDSDGDDGDNPFDMDELDDGNRGGDAGTPGDKEKARLSEGARMRRLVSEDEVADRLDALMDQVFDFLSYAAPLQGVGASGVDDGGLGEDVFDGLLAAFETTILPTHRAKFTQFLVFHACAVDPRLKELPRGLGPDSPRAAELVGRTWAGRFVKLLLAILLDATVHATSRVTAAAYLASFLARAGFVPDVLVVLALDSLSGFCVRYSEEKAEERRKREVEEAERLSRGESRRKTWAQVASGMGSRRSSGMLDVDAHQAFYAACQAIFYILCYRLPPRESGGGGGTGVNGVNGGGGGPSATFLGASGGTVTPLLRALPGLRLQRMVDSFLDPLAVCLPTVVSEFLARVKPYSHVRWSADDVDKQVSHGFGGKHQLDMFFPFDPYLLRRSHRCIAEAGYTHWVPSQSDGKGDDGAYGYSSDEDDDGEGAVADMLGESDSDSDSILDGGDDTSVGAAAGIVGSYKEALLLSSAGGANGIPNGQTAHPLGNGTGRGAGQHLSFAVGSQGKWGVSPQNGFSPTVTPGAWGGGGDPPVGTPTGVGPFPPMGGSAGTPSSGGAAGSYLGRTPSGMPPRAAAPYHGPGVAHPATKVTGFATPPSRPARS